MTRYPNTTRCSPLPRPGRLIFSAAVLPLFVTVWLSPAHGQINPFRGYRGPTLTREDLDAGRAAAQKLLESDQPSVGQAESWTGPTTGNHGTLTIRRGVGGGPQARRPCGSGGVD